MSLSMTPSRQAPRSGRQHALRAFGYEASIASVGASLRTLAHEGRELILPYGADELRPAYRGATLAPWPGRVVDGRYTFAGARHQLPITEPGRGHALHGLVAWLDFATTEQSPEGVTLRAVIEPQAGYPWRVLVTTRYALTEQGMVQSVRAENLSREPAPFGAAPHPYLVAGAGSVDDWVLQLPATKALSITPDRLVPVGLGPVPDELDFRLARRLGGTRIDHAFTGLGADAGGETVLRLTAADGGGVEMSWGESCPWVQLYTADAPGRPEHRAGLAVEPMTCAPDAFNVSEYEFDPALLVLEPGASTEACWRIGAV